jgi:hypothetical protein
MARREAPDRKRMGIRSTMTRREASAPSIEISRKCNKSAGLIGSIRSKFVKKDVYPVRYLVIVDDLHPDAFR